MSHHTKIDENLEGADNFRSWKYRISLVLEENELDSYISEELPVPEGDEEKVLHKKKLVTDKRINVDLIKDHVIPQVSSLKTPKAMFDALTKLFEGEEHKPKDDSEKPTEECEDSKCRNNPVLHHKSFSDQGTTGSSG